MQPPCTSKPSPGVHSYLQLIGALQPIGAAMHACCREACRRVVAEQAATDALALRLP
jgi:hypothetical protein